MPTVCILPTLAEWENRTWGGVLRCAEALCKYAPEWEWKITDNPDTADVVHTLGMKEHPRSKIYTCLGFWENKVVPEYEKAQRKIERLATQSQVFTVLSQWAKEFFEERIGRSAEVISLGADYSIMQTIMPTSSTLDFLWAKAGTYFPNCNYGATPVVELAKHMPNYLFGLTVVSPELDLVSPNGKNDLSNVVVVGQQAYNNMLRIIASCKVYISTVKETFGAQTIEAMAMGKPVLAYNFGGSTEILTHMVDGFLVPPGDSLLEGATYILEHYAEMSLAARKTAIKYDWRSVVIPQYIQCWEKVL